MKIVIDKNIPFLDTVFEPYADVVCKGGAEITSADVADADALLVRTRTHCDARLLAGSAVKFIGTATIGYDHIDAAYCDSAGIRWATAAGCNARGVLQYVLTVLRTLIDKPCGQTVGVVGVGNVGSLVAEFCRNLGFRVVCTDPPRMAADPSLGFVDLDELLAQSDIVTLHVPLTDTTRLMADTAFFEQMKRGAYFINTSRGEVVDEDALMAASGRLSAYVLDVWQSEPAINQVLMSEALIATPHIAGYSLQGKALGTAMVVRALSAFFGLPLTDWYPEGVTPTVPNPNIPWDEITGYNIFVDDEALRMHPENFEQLRNDYDYRIERF